MSRRTKQRDQDEKGKATNFSQILSFSILFKKKTFPVVVFYFILFIYVIDDENNTQKSLKTSEYWTVVVTFF